MKVNIISVVSNKNERNPLPLHKKVEAGVEEFLKGVKGELENYELSGTELEEGLVDGQAVILGKTLVTIHWNPKGKGEK